jgi:hypothetical protein
MLKGLGPAIMALLLASVWSPHHAIAGPDQCTLDNTGTIATCSGNQLAGIAYLDQPQTTINVQNLTTPIAPATGTPGVALRATTSSPARRPRASSLQRQAPSLRRRYK